MSAAPPSDATLIAPSPFGEADAARWFFENANDLFAVISPQGRFVSVNPAWTAVTGWTAQELIGGECANFVHPDSHADLIEAGRRIREDGAAINRLRVLCKDGRSVWLEGRSRRGPNGEMVGTLHDVSAQLGAERTREMLAEAAGVGVWSYDPRTETIDWSPDALSLAGIQPGDLTSASQFLERLPVEQRDAFQQLFHDAVRSGQPGVVEFRLRGADGRWFTFRSTFRAEPLGCGLFALKGISQNITDLVRSRDAAVWGERRARSLVEEAPFAVAVYDQDLILRVASPRFLEIFKAREEDVIGRSLHDLTRGMRRRFVAAVTRALSGEVVMRREDRLEDSEGVEHCLRWEGRPWRNVAGEIVGVITYMDDVTAVSATRREARANARRLKIALGAARAGVYEIDHAGRAFWGSPEFHRLLGRKVTYEDVREAVWPMIHPEDRAAIHASADVWRRTGAWGARSIDARLVTPSGEERWLRIFHEVRRDAAGRIRKAFGLVLDIDDKKRAELALVEAERAAQAASEAKAQFVANMSHEIRTPMNGVLGVMHLLKRQALPEDAAGLLDEALACGRMLSTLLDDVIDISRIEAGRLEINREPVDPRELLTSVARLLSTQVEHKGLTLKIEAPADLGWIDTDPTRLRQALFNLIGNAVKFTLKGSVIVRARRVERPAGPQLAFDVIDTGVGVPRAAQARLFDRFEQGDASTTRRFGGSGLGLAITRRLAEMLGGGVAFISEPGVGSCFTLTIAAPPVAPVAADRICADDILSGLRILLVEDNPTNQMVASRILEQLGAVVHTADDGLAGVEAVRIAPFDLVLMDVQMPGIDGLEASRRIRALPGAAGRTPIIALTANVMAHQQAAYRAAGMDGVAAKPIVPAALITEILRLAETDPDTAVA
jgi:PAS domain S-box-containing protein